MNEYGRNSMLTLSVGLSDVTVPTDIANYSVIEASHFCTRANVQSSIVYLSQELQSMGLSRRIVEAGGTSVNLIALINACWECLQLYHAAVRDGDLLQDQRRRDSADLHHLQNSIQGLKGSVEEKERLVCDAQEKERQTSTINRSLATKLKVEKEEVRRLSSVMQQREAQCQHELRKKEVCCVPIQNENSKLRERLHRLLSSDRSVGTKASGLVMTASLTRADKARGKWKTEATGVRHEEELHRRVLAQYESWVGQLSAENDLLKSVLSVISSQVSKLNNKLNKENQLPQDVDMSTSLTSSTFSADSLEDPIFSLDFKTVSEQVQATLEENIKAISYALEEKKEKERKEEEEVKVLQEKVNDMNLKLAKANDQINSYKVITEKNLPSEGELTFLVDGGCVEERAVIEKEREALTEERKSMQLEREKFTDAVIRLNRERALFEAEKVELLRQQFLQELPTSLNDSITSGHESGESLSNCSFANEMFSDSPNRLLAMPCVTSPQGNVTTARNAQPALLGPVHIPQQSRTSSARSSRAPSLCRLRSAPSSRSSSVTRKGEEVKGGNSRKETRLSNQSGIPCSLQPKAHTLERLTRPPRLGVRSPQLSHSHSRSGSETPRLSLPVSTIQSSSAVEAPKHSLPTQEGPMSMPVSYSEYDGDSILKVFQDYYVRNQDDSRIKRLDQIRSHGRPLSVGDDYLNGNPEKEKWVRYGISPKVTQAARRLASSHPFCPQDEDQFDSDNNNGQEFLLEDEIDNITNAPVNKMEDDLAHLIYQITKLKSQNQSAPVTSPVLSPLPSVMTMSDQPSFNRTPPCYSSLYQEDYRAVPRNPKTVRPRPSLPSHLISAPGSLSSSRRSSQDASTVEEILKSRQALAHRKSPKQGENE